MFVLIGLSGGPVGLVVTEAADGRIQFDRFGYRGILPGEKPDAGGGAGAGAVGAADCIVLHENFRTC